MYAKIVASFGPDADRHVLVEMRSADAHELFDVDTLIAAPLELVDAVRRDIDAIRARDPQLADSGLAALALRLAFEVDHPYAENVSSSSRALHDVLAELRKLAPPMEAADGVDEVKTQREQRRSRSAAAANSAGS